MNTARARLLIGVLCLTGCSAWFGGRGDTASQITAAEDAFALALQRSDTASLNALLGYEFEFATGDPGRPPVDRSAWFGNIVYGNVRTDSIGYRELAVVAPTPDSAIATLWLHWKPILRGHVESTDITRVEDTWVRRNDRWQVVRRRLLERKQPS
jgi:hypothetical protein